MSAPKPLKIFSKTLFKIYFIIFNGILLLIAYVGLLPYMALQVSVDPQAGWLPWDFAVPLLGLVAVPTSIAVTTIKRPKTPLPSLARIFYGIEMPLLFLFSFRFFVLRELNPATIFLLITAVLGIAAFTYRNFWRDRPTPAWGLWLQMIGHGLFLASAIYLLGMFLFYEIPITWWMIASLPTTVMVSVIGSPVTIILFGFYSLPWGMLYLAIRGSKGMVKAFASKVGMVATISIAVAIPLVWVGGLVALQHQPQSQALDLLAKPAQNSNQREILLGKADQIRAGLLNAYLSKYRYLGEATSASVDEYGHVDGFMGNMYSSAFRLPAAAAVAVEQAFNVWAAPFLYQGKFADSEEAAKRYAQFFDQPILRAEPQAISAAVNSTFDRTTSKAGLMDINQEKVLLAQQDLTVTPHGDWADVSIHEVYRNRTTDQQEVLYYFSLPETAAITGVWLGESADLNKRFAFQVSPRGAAQQVYSNQLARRVDPALLEQVGPGNYRLRAFPVLPAKDKPMHLWLTYKTMQLPGGGWPLPQLHERRNIFWNGSTQRTYNGKPQGNDQPSWFPNQITATAQPAKTHQTNFASGDRLEAAPFVTPESRSPVGERYAVILDSSYSMGQQRQSLRDSLDWLKKNVLANNAIDLYLTNANGVAPTQVENFSQFNPNQIQFYGTLQPKQMLAQFMKLRPANRKYDAILLLTDPGSYELTDDSRFQASLPAPLWMVHLGGLAAAYDDDTQAAIKNSRGGVVTEVATAIEQAWVRRQMGANVVNIADGYTWSRSPATQTPTAQPKPGSSPNFTPLAARQLVLARGQALQPTQVGELDAIHAIAKQHAIVTPYSSMIVLVNDQQRRELQAAENAEDRFNREVEDQQLPQPGGVPELSGVPEPAEWLLLLLGVGLLYLGYRFPHWLQHQSQEETVE
jgi:putative PEP-CTERM system integral membrane protein